MGHHHGGELVLIADLHELLLQVAPAEGIEGPEGFIEQQQLRLDRQGAGDRHPLAHAAGQFAGQLVAGMAQAHHLDVLLHQGLAVLAGEAGHHLIDGQGDVLLHREPGQQRVVLEHHHLVGARALHRFAIHQHRAARGQIEAGDHVQQRALATAGVADQGDEFAFADVEIDSLEGQVIATTIEGKVLLEILNFYKSCHGFVGRSGH